jgi:hypothetical protein
MYERAFNDDDDDDDFVVVVVCGPSIEEELSGSSGVRSS